MNHIKAYLLSIVAAAMICSFITAFFGKKSIYYALIRLLSGLFLSITVVAPWKIFRPGQLTSYIDIVSADASAAADVGKQSYIESVSEIIKSRTEAYILDKAISMGLDIDVEVKLDHADLPSPHTVVITGAVSPYAKEILTDWIAKDLAVPEDAQIWK